MGFLYLLAFLFAFLSLGSAQLAALEFDRRELQSTESPTCPCITYDGGTCFASPVSPSGIYSHSIPSEGRVRGRGRGNAPEGSAENRKAFAPVRERGEAGIKTGRGRALRV